MLKLYKNNNGQLQYWETWEENSSQSVVHWGTVGEKGNNKRVSGEVIENEINQRIHEGYSEFDEGVLSILIIEYAVEGAGTKKDIEKQHALESRMDETLGWTGLGHCDAGRIGPGTMEIACLVVDYEIAKKVIEEDLKGTGYADYKRIYKGSN